MKATGRPVVVLHVFAKKSCRALATANVWIQEFKGRRQGRGLRVAE